MARETRIMPQEEKGEEVRGDERRLEGMRKRRKEKRV